MSTYVFLNIPALGHINPTLPIVDALTSHGETVIYCLPDKFRETVEAVGAKFQTFPRETLFNSADSRDDKSRGDERIALIPFAMAWSSMDVVPQLVEIIKAAKPDCLVYNVMHLWARMAARILGIPAVGFRPFHAPREHRSVTGPFATPALADLALTADRELARLSGAFELPSVTLNSLVSEVEDLTLIFMPKEFQQGADAFDERFLFVGPSLRASEPEQRLLEEQPSDTRTKIYVSLGTLRNNLPEFYRACFSAFSPKECRVVMSVGHQIDIDVLGPVPENFIIVPSAPQLALLPKVDVFVSHGGLNSTMESLYFGVPLVVVPSIREQKLTARRVQELGIGVVLDHAGLTPDTLREAALTVGRDTGIRDRMIEMRQLTRAAGGAKRAAAAIIHFAAG